MRPHFDSKGCFMANVVIIKLGIVVDYFEKYEDRTI